MTIYRVAFDQAVVYYIDVAADDADAAAVKAEELRRAGTPFTSKLEGEIAKYACDVYPADLWGLRG